MSEWGVWPYYRLGECLVRVDLSVCLCLQGFSGGG